MPASTEPPFWAVLQARHPGKSDPVAMTLVDILEIEGLAAWVSNALQASNRPATPQRDDAGPESLKEQAKALEVQQIRRALEEAGGNQSAAALRPHQVG